MTNLARCCKPAPPDAIVGYVTRGKGVTIHRKTCATSNARVRASGAVDRRRLGTARDEVFPVDVVLEAITGRGCCGHHRNTSRERINVTAANTLTRNSATRMAFTLEAIRRALPGACPCATYAAFPAGRR
jgi:GTP pyrophosphokinase